MNARTVALVLAGGNGTRLGDLTRWECKPALSFAGKFRNIDFSLSNCVHSGIRRVAVLTQYKSQTLIRHLEQAWSFLPRSLGEFVELWPAQQRVQSDCVIVEAGCRIPDGLAIGADPGVDAERFQVSPSGIALVSSDAPSRAAHAVGRHPVRATGNV